MPAFLELGWSLGLIGKLEMQLSLFQEEAKGQRLYDPPPAPAPHYSHLHWTFHSNPFHDQEVVGILPLKCHHLWNPGLEANQPFGYLSRRQREVSAEGCQYKRLLCKGTWEYFKLSTFKSQYLSRSPRTDSWVCEMEKQRCKGWVTGRRLFPAVEFKDDEREMQQNIK